MGKVKYKTSAQEEWDDRTHTIKAHKYKDPFFHDLLKDIIPNGRDKSCIELGAMPGNYLAYFYKKYGYSITGLDFSKHTEIFLQTMKVNGIKDYKFLTADILSYNTSDKYDLVCSFGLIEHFDDVSNILEKHIDLVSDGGLLLITVPNFRYFQWLYHKIFDGDNLSIHNTDAMKPEKINSCLQRHGMQKIVNQPFGMSEFWYEDVITNAYFRNLRYSVTARLNTSLRKIRNNRLTAPYLIYLYKKP